MPVDRHESHCWNRDTVVLQPHALAPTHTASNGPHWSAKSRLTLKKTSSAQPAGPLHGKLPRSWGSGATQMCWVVDLRCGFNPMAVAFPHVNCCATPVTLAGLRLGEGTNGGGRGLEEGETWMGLGVA